MKKFFTLSMSLLLASCSSQVAFTTDSSVQSSDIGVLRTQEFMCIGDEEAPMILYVGAVQFIPVGQGLRGSEGSVTFKHDARFKEQQVSFTYPSENGTVSRTVRFIPDQVKEVMFSRSQGILLRLKDGETLVRPRSEARICTED